MPLALPPPWRGCIFHGGTGGRKMSKQKTKQKTLSAIHKEADELTKHYPKKFRDNCFTEAVAFLRGKEK
jgi:hypothetical protein